MEKIEKTHQRYGVCKFLKQTLCDKRDGIFRRQLYRKNIFGGIPHDMESYILVLFLQHVMII